MLHTCRGQYALTTAWFLHQYTRLKTESTYSRVESLSSLQHDKHVIWVHVKRQHWRWTLWKKVNELCFSPVCISSSCMTVQCVLMCVPVFRPCLVSALSALSCQAVDCSHVAHAPAGSISALRHTGALCVSHHRHCPWSAELQTEDSAYNGSQSKGEQNISAPCSSEVLRNLIDTSDTVYSNKCKGLSSTQWSFIKNDSNHWNNNGYTYI